MADSAVPCRECAEKWKATPNGKRYPSAFSHLKCRDALVATSGVTHTAECWRDHHGCAVRKLDDMRRELAAWTAELVGAGISHGWTGVRILGIESDDRSATHLVPILRQIAAGDAARAAQREHFAASVTAAFGEVQR